MNIYQESTINFWICRNYEGPKYGLCITHAVWHDCLSPFSSHSKSDRKEKGHVLVLWFLSPLFGSFLYILTYEYKRQKQRQYILWKLNQPTVLPQRTKH